MTWITLRGNVGAVIALVVLIATLLMGFMGMISRETVLAVSAICAIGIR